MNETKSEGVMNCGCLLMVLLLNVTIGGLLVRYDVQFWASYFKGTQVAIPMFPCAIAGLFLGEIALPVAIITWLLSFVI